MRTALILFFLSFGASAEQGLIHAERVEGPAAEKVEKTGNEYRGALHEWENQNPELRQLKKEQLEAEEEYDNALDELVERTPELKHLREAYIKAEEAYAEAWHGWFSWLSPNKLKQLREAQLEAFEEYNITLSEVRDQTPEVRQLKERLLTAVDRYQKAKDEFVNQTPELRLLRDIYFQAMRSIHGSH